MKFLTATLLSLLLLSACGFSPVYGDKSTSQTVESSSLKPQFQFNHIKIAIIPNREGQFLRNALIDRFYSQGTPQNPTYELRMSTISERIYDFDITQESEATRRQLRLSTTLTLIDTATKKTILSRPLSAIASNNVLESEFSTLVTEQYARENALNDLARQAERQISLYFTK